MFARVLDVVVRTSTYQCVGIINACERGREERDNISMLWRRGRRGGEKKV